MARFLTSAALSFILYLLLTTGTGSIGLWSGPELVVGVLFSVLVAALARNLTAAGWPRILDPRRWALFLIYLAGPFFLAMTKANIDVAMRVITGRIKPAIVRVSPQLKSEAAITLLANSITLTPGTLTVDIDEETNDLFIHWIHVNESALQCLPLDHKAVCGGFPGWARRIAE